MESFGVRKIIFEISWWDGRGQEGNIRKVESQVNWDWLVVFREICIVEFIKFCVFIFFQLELFVFYLNFQKILLILLFSIFFCGFIVIYIFDVVIRLYVFSRLS